MGSEGFAWFFGVVEDRDDPLKLGRLRVRVHSIHDDKENIPTDSLHWASVILPITSASLNGIGISPTGIKVGTTVFGFFADGSETQLPIILGTLAGIPEEGKHDVVRLARGVAGIQKQLLTGVEPESAYKAKYPYNKTITTEGGHAIEVDDTPGSERLHVYHKSGTYVEIDHKGQRATKVVDNDIEIVVKDNKVYIGGDCEVTVLGNITINGSKRISIKAGKAIDIAAPGGVVITEGSLSVAGGISSGVGVTGSFTTPTGQIVHVQNGLVTNIY
jgi:hypothetical protein